MRIGDVRFVDPINYRSTQIPHADKLWWYGGDHMREVHRFELKGRVQRYGGVASRVRDKHIATMMHQPTFWKDARRYQEHRNKPRNGSDAEKNVRGSGQSSIEL
ncbi:uncharacterized protein [Drosophila pseudoobscura]|uniref:Uncharacterized protein n=1 Tax=Drosophila pseudoobscura pseudoobscura TaxID=46245 RepID=A0A6I8VT91_DROPS|nr:uncharacterized protein LOC117183641 [Drosophila pseudoobscura]